MNDNVEQEIPAKGPTALRVTPADIASEHYFTAADGAGRLSETATDVGANGLIPQSLHLLTFCVLVLKNGLTVTGESACASPENFDAEVGRKIARRNAVAKTWPLMGCTLKQLLSEQ